MVEIHKTVAKVLETHKDELEIFECLDEFSDTQNFSEHYGFDIEDACNAILIKSKNILFFTFRFQVSVPRTTCI